MDQQTFTGSSGLSAFSVWLVDQNLQIYVPITKRFMKKSIFDQKCVVLLINQPSNCLGWISSLYLQFGNLNSSSPSFFFFFSDLISQLLDPVVDPWLDRETCFNMIPVPESYTGPRLSFPLSVSDTNALLSAFKEQQVNGFMPS